MKVYACFACVWLAKSRCIRKVSIKLPVTGEFRLAHQEWRGQGEIAHSMNQNGDHTGILALLPKDPITLTATRWQALWERVYYASSAWFIFFFCRFSFNFSRPFLAFFHAIFFVVSFSCLKIE
uniref:Uncharacterized protein n=1 Tax=Ixodes ricinus TaxID=34613 RepID=A0A6B0UPK9_IXORI